MGSDLSQGLIRETLTIWRQRYPALSEDGAREIVSNMCSLFNLLAEWDQQTMDAETGLPQTEDGGENAA